MIKIERYEKSKDVFYYIKDTDLLHREDGPAVERASGHKEWWIRGKLHREDGPALIDRFGKKEWWVNGEKHREGGPAIIYPNGTKYWYSKGRLHRDDGPACTSSDGVLILWYLDNNFFFTKEEWFEALTEEQKVKAIYSEVFMIGSK
jgi:hypothetical protein